MRYGNVTPLVFWGGIYISQLEVIMRNDVGDNHLCNHVRIEPSGTAIDWSTTA